jgi:hypothetical protein
MNASRRNVFLANLAVAIIGVGSLSAFVRAAVFPPQTEVCSARYTKGAAFAMQHSSGELMTREDLEAQLDFRAWGIARNVSVVKDGKAPGGVAIDVKIAKGSINPKHPTAPKGGMGFRWRNILPRGTDSACLSYGLWLPADFAFNRGGKLPGLFGGDGPTGGRKADGKNGFSTRLMWRRKGAGEVYAYVPGAPEGRGKSISRGSFTLPRGRWVKVEQEVRLNTPGSKDGKLRVWIDGELAIEQDDMVYRSSPNLHVAGVMADIFYGGKSEEWAAPKDTHLRLSPFQVYWK